MNNESEFYKLLKASPGINLGAFENNWTYIVQSTRDNLFIERSLDSIVYYTYKDNDSAIIVNSLGPKRKLVVLNLCKKLQKEIKCIIIKNVDLMELDWWIENGFSKKNTPWSKYSSMDDNSFAQYNIHKNTVETRDFKEDIKRQIRYFEKNRNITTVPYENIYNSEVMKMLIDFSKYSENKGNDYASEVVNAHKFFFDDSITTKIMLQHMENNKLIGVSFLTPVEDVCFYNMVICGHERNIMKYLVYKSMEFVISKYPTIRLFGMQGSENKGQDYLKKRLNPFESINKIHLIYKG
ncbi:MAG: hypothetical protein WAV31_04255 [Candidatus Moraniibacteriota bacterium]